MKLADITVGAPVYVTRGYARRPATVTGTYNGRVYVAYDDVDPTDPAIARIADRHDLFGATVLPRQVEPR